MFSCIQPRTHIRPHVGYYQYSNRILRCHLGITIPKDGQTALKVNGQIQTWEEGKCFVFDDTFRHEAYNKSPTTTRVVLMIDFECKTDPSLRNPDFFWGFVILLV
jgi:ornithine lipid ester-linked acyl 2-hydroxylase